LKTRRAGGLCVGALPDVSASREYDTRRILVENAHAWARVVINEREMYATDLGRGGR
jgi:hypothetical protein